MDVISLTHFVQISTGKLKLHRRYALCSAKVTTHTPSYISFIEIACTHNDVNVDTVPVHVKSFHQMQMMMVKKATMAIVNVMRQPFQ